MNKKRPYKTYPKEFKEEAVFGVNYLDRFASIMMAD